MNIVFIVTCPFPTGEASSIRALNLTRLIVEAGHTVHVIADVQGNECQGVPCTYECVSTSGKNLQERTRNAKLSIQCLKKYCDEHRVDAILTNARYDRYDSVARICKEKQIKLYVENCEWYDFSNFKLKFLDYRYLLNQKMILFGFKKAHGFISISRFLHQYNSGLGKKSVRIPTIMDVANTPVGRGSGQKRIQVVYTGNPGVSKEFLAPVIELLAKNKGISERIQFHIYGVDEKRVLINQNVTKDMIQQAGDSVIIHGRVPQNDIQNILMNADYQLFLRPQRRSSNAGFPTKLGESMAVGTPVIANDTGDIGLYIKDSMNGYLLKEGTAENVETVFEKIINISTEKYMDFRRHARKTAEESFDYRRYKLIINSLFDWNNVN